MADALRPYEVMILLDADLDEETIRAAVERWLVQIESGGAERGHVDFWGKRRLAYEINRKPDGYYVVFQARSLPAPHLPASTGSALSTSRWEPATPIECCARSSCSSPMRS